MTDGKTPHIDNVDYGYPDLRFSHLVFYVVRPASSVAGPLLLAEWHDHVARSADLVLDEVYPQENINRERLETWQELGRTRWQAPDGVEFYHFRPAGVGFVGVHGQPDLKTVNQRSRLQEALPEDPLLDDWLRIVEQSRFMELEAGQAEPRRAWWVGRDGTRKALLTWEPPSIWMYQMPVSRFYDAPPRPDPARRDRCERLARELSAVVETAP